MFATMASGTNGRKAFTQLVSHICAPKTIQMPAIAMAFLRQDRPGRGCGSGACAGEGSMGDGGWTDVAGVYAGGGRGTGDGDQLDVAVDSCEGDEAGVTVGSEISLVFGCCWLKVAP